MTRDRDRAKSGIGNVISNWNRSDLPVLRRLGLAFANYSRRLRIPPQTCCGHPGEPGC